MPSNEMIVLLGTLGFSYRCISRLVYHDEPQSHRAKIAAVLKAADIRLRDYRDGTSRQAKITIATLKKPKNKTA